MALENKAYQRKLEEMVDELNARQEQRKLELAALNKLFQSHLGQADSTRTAYGKLQDSLTSFTSELEELATIAGVPAQEQRNGAADYKVQKVK